VQAVSPELLKAVAASMPEKPKAATGRNGGRRVALGTEFDLDGWIRDKGVPVKRSGGWNRDG
jgi:hypothetical protein